MRFTKGKSHCEFINNGDKYHCDIAYKINPSFVCSQLHLARSLVTFELLWSRFVAPAYSSAVLAHTTGPFGRENTFTKNLQGPGTPSPSIGTQHDISSNCYLITRVGSNRAKRAA